MKLNRTRDQQFAIRLTEQKLALFQQKQRASGLNKTDFFGQMLKGTKVKVYYFSDALKILYQELRHIGVNLNQIAFTANIGRTWEANDSLHRMQDSYLAVMERVGRFLDAPLVNAYTVEVTEQPDSYNPLESKECHSETST